MRLSPVVVSATRSVDEIKSIPHAITVIEREEIDRQATVTRSVPEILANLVPGLATGTLGNTNSTQTLRGRDIMVMIDGVPQTTVRNVMRDLLTIDQSAIERIEVIRGATALYGKGASGGAINIITRKGEAGDLRLHTQVGATASLTNPSADSLSGRLQQTASGAVGPVDYTFTLAAEGTQGFFDAQGDRIPPDPSQGDLSDSTKYNILGKIGGALDEDQRLQLTVNHLNSQQDTEYLSDPSVRTAPRRSVDARAIEGLVLDEQPETVNTVASLDYTHQDILGNGLQAQVYYRDYQTRFFPFDGRRFGAWNNIAQTYLDSETYGGRLAVETPVSVLGEDDVTLLWGADYENETTSQPATIYDPVLFDRSGGRVYRSLGDRTFVPDITHESIGLFAQGEWAVAEDWVLRTGVRHEMIQASHDTFTTLGQRNVIQAAEAEYSDTLFNAGVVHYLTDEIDLYANFSQGFSLPDLGLALRGAGPNFTIANATVEPIKVNSYEIGSRGDWGWFDAEVSLFYTTSDSGVSSNGFTATMVRAPERTYGIETAVNATLTDQWGIGGTLGWTEGEHDPDGDGNFTPLNNRRIPPIKVTAYVDYEPFEWWNARLQGLYSGNRDRAFDSGVSFSGDKVDSFMVFDLINTFDVGYGQLEVGVANLFNTDYHSVHAQILPDGTNTSYVAAPGTTLTVNYSMTW